jgi:hypothetical protein
MFLEIENRKTRFLVIRKKNFQANPLSVIKAKKYRVPHFVPGTNNWIFRYDYDLLRNSRNK